MTVVSSPSSVREQNYKSEIKDAPPAMRSRTTLVTIICFFSFMTAVIAMPTRARREQVLYSEVVDKAFQFSKGIPAEFQAFYSRIVIRYLPSFGSTEWQIVALKEGSGTYRVIRYGIKPGT